MWTSLGDYYSACCSIQVTGCSVKTDFATLAHQELIDSVDQWPCVLILFFLLSNRSYDCSYFILSWPLRSNSRLGWLSFRPQMIGP